MNNYQACPSEVKQRRGQFASPYVGMGNIPHLGVDPDGGFTETLAGITITASRLASYAQIAARTINGVMGAVDALRPPDWYLNLETNTPEYFEDKNGEKIDGYKHLGEEYTQFNPDGTAYKLTKDGNAFTTLNEIVISDGGGKNAGLFWRQYAASSKEWAPVANLMTTLVTGIVPVGSALNLLKLGKVAKYIPKGKLHKVYQAFDKSGVTRYVGRTKQELSKRISQHMSDPSKTLLQFEQVQGNLTLMEARVLEQKLINIHGLGKNGGTLLNKINSIAPSKWTMFGL